MTIIDLITRHEGVRLKPYRDSVGKLTLGIGRNLDDVGITVSEAQYLLENDLGRVCADLDSRLPWWRTLDLVRQMVVQDMAFNLGIGGLLGFTQMLAHVEAGRYPEAAGEMLDSRWARQVGDEPGQRAHTLAAMMRTGALDFDSLDHDLETKAS